MLVLLFTHSLSCKCLFVRDNVAGDVLGAEDRRVNEREVVISPLRGESMVPSVLRVMGFYIKHRAGQGTLTWQQQSERASGRKRCLNSDLKDATDNNNHNS